MNKNMHPDIYKKQSGNTISSDIVQIFNVMMGYFSAQITFDLNRNENNIIYITVTGFVTTNAFGKNSVNDQMQKGGSESNWAQRDLFKRVEEMVESYQDVVQILYLSQ